MIPAAGLWKWKCVFGKKGPKFVSLCVKQQLIVSKPEVPRSVLLIAKMRPALSSVLNQRQKHFKHKQKTFKKFEFVFFIYVSVE